MPPKKHKGKGPASASVASSMFAIDYASDLGKVVQMPGSFWGMKGDDADSLFDCTVAQYQHDFTFSGSSKSARAFITFVLCNAP